MWNITRGKNLVGKIYRKSRFFYRFQRDEKNVAKFKKNGEIFYLIFDDDGDDSYDDDIAQDNTKL